LSNISCGNATQKDVADQQKKIESISFQISHYINARKSLVTNYNELLKYPKTESNKNDINRSLAQIYEKIAEYDEKIEDLAEDKLEAIDDLNEYISDLEINYAPDKPIDPNRRDFLLTIK
jgi:chromosome segregation ATPase